MSKSVLKRLQILYSQESVVIPDEIKILLGITVLFFVISILWYRSARKRKDNAEKKLKTDTVGTDYEKATCKLEEWSIRDLQKTINNLQLLDDQTNRERLAKHKMI